MAYRKILVMSMAAAIGLGAAGGAVAETGKSVSPPAAKTAAAAKISLASAITTAQRHTAGRAIKVRTEREKGVVVYQVTLLAERKLQNVYVSASDGKVIRVEDEGRIDKEDRAEMAKFLAAPTTLTAAIKTAVANGGKAVGAEFENEDGRSLIDVKVAEGNHVRSVRVDAASGKIVEAGDQDREDGGEHDND